jgi:hypothetical protein
MHGMAVFSSVAILSLSENLETLYRYSRRSRGLEEKLLKFIKSEKDKNFLKKSNFRDFELIVPAFVEDMPFKHFVE